MLSERGQLQKDKCHVIPLNEVSGVVKFTETESGMVIARGWRKETTAVVEWVQSLFYTMK